MCACLLLCNIPKQMQRSSTMRHLMLAFPPVCHTSVRDTLSSVEAALPSDSEGSAVEDLLLELLEENAHIHPPLGVKDADLKTNEKTPEVNFYCHV